MLPLVLAALLMAVPIGYLSPGDHARGCGAAFALLLICLTMLRAAWLGAGRGRVLALGVALAFLLRLGGGILLSEAYRVWGYDKPVYNAGYLFLDAMDRDTEAWQVARSGQAIFFNPELRLGSDQYGGLGLLSAAIYRSLSPDAHRPYLMLILGAAVYSLGLPFLLRAGASRWGTRAAAIAGWIYILYPDGIFFTAAQMREPLLIGLSAVALYGVLRMHDSWRGGAFIVMAALLLMLPISPPATAFIGVCLALLAWIEYGAERLHAARWLVLAGLALGAVVLAGASWAFLREASGWDAVLAETSSGMVASVVDQLGGKLRLPFLTLYGLFRPVLPAAIFEPSIPLAKTIALLRSLGWYALLPLLAYAPLAVRHLRPGVERLRGFWLTLLPWLWMPLASLRAGGDESDNPRYRLILFALICLAAGWAWMMARAQRDRWLGRIFLMELVFLLGFSQWYAARYLHVLTKLPFLNMAAIMAALMAGIVAWGVARDRLEARRKGGDPS